MNESGLISKLREQKWIPYSIVSLILFLTLFLPFLYFYIAPFIGLILIIESKTRIHGVFFLITSAYFWSIAILAISMNGLPVSDYNFMWGWAMFLVYFLKPFFTMAVAYNLMVLFPVILFEIGYFVYKNRNWKTIIVSSVFLVSFCGFGLSYANSCARKFETLEPLQGQTIQQEELFQRIGNPVYYRDQMKLGYYVKGEHMICVEFYDDGTCKILEGQGWFLD